MDLKRQARGQRYWAQRQCSICRPPDAFPPTDERTPPVIAQTMGAGPVGAQTALFYFENCRLANRQGTGDRGQGQGFPDSSKIAKNFKFSENFEFSRPQGLDRGQGTGDRGLGDRDSQISPRLPKT